MMSISAPAEMYITGSDDRNSCFIPLNSCRSSLRSELVNVENFIALIASTLSCICAIRVSEILVDVSLSVARAMLGTHETISNTANKRILFFITFKFKW